MRRIWGWWPLSTRWRNGSREPTSRLSTTPPTRSFIGCQCLGAVGSTMTRMCCITSRPTQRRTVRADGISRTTSPTFTWLARCELQPSGGRARPSAICDGADGVFLLVSRGPGVFTQELMFARARCPSLTCFGASEDGPTTMRETQLLLAVRFRIMRWTSMLGSTKSWTQRHCSVNQSSVVRWALQR